MGADYTLLRSGETSPSYFETTVNSHVSTTEFYLEKDFLGVSATDESISMPRLIGPGCITIASDLASASRSSVKP